MRSLASRVYVFPQTLHVLDLIGLIFSMRLGLPEGILEIGRAEPPLPAFAAEFLSSYIFDNCWKYMNEDVSL